MQHEDIEQSATWDRETYLWLLDEIDRLRGEVERRGELVRQVRRRALGSGYHSPEELAAVDRETERLLEGKDVTNQRRRT